MRKLRLAFGWGFAPASDSRAVLISAARGQSVELPLAEGITEAVELLQLGIPALNPESHLAKVCALPLNTLADLVRDLRSAGALVVRDDDHDLGAQEVEGFYDRQLRFLSYYESQELTAFDLNDRLQDRRVVVPGLGGLGGWVALLCARMGIRSIVGIDPDRVESSNLHRQVLYNRADIGALKAEAAKRPLELVDPQVEFLGHAVEIVSASQFAEFADGADLVINAFPLIPSFAEASRFVSHGSLLCRVPCLNMPLPQSVGPLTVPGETACLSCAEQDLAPYLDERNPAWRRHPFLGALAPRQAFVAGAAVWEAVRFLSGMDRPKVLDGIAWLDISAYSHHRFLEISRKSNCEFCA